MPNWVENAIELHGLQQDIEAAAELLMGPDGNVDFGKIIPMPEEIRSATDGRSEAWAREHWGTKWNAFETDLAVDAAGPDSSIIGTFMTAWTPPEPVMKELSRRLPDLDIVLQCTSDDVMEYVVLRGGTTVDEGREELDCDAPEL